MPLFNVGNTGMAQSAYPYIFANKLAIAAAIASYSWMGQVDIDIGTTDVVPMDIARFGRFVNRSPYPIYHIFHPDINIRLIAKAVVVYILFKPASGIGFYYCQFLATVKIRPPPRPKAEPWMQ